MSLSICLLYSMMGFGSLCSATLVKKYGRVATLLISTAIYFLSIISCSIFVRPLDFYTVLIIRIISNFSLGVFNLVILNLYSEFLPIKNRCFILMVNSGFYNIGNLGLISLNYYFAPAPTDSGRRGNEIFLNNTLRFLEMEYEQSNFKNITSSINIDSSFEQNNIHRFSSSTWRMVNTLTSIPGIITFFIILFFCHESPLYLLNNNRDEEAFEILEKMSPRQVSQNSPTLTIAEKNKIKESIMKRKNYELTSNFRELFLPEYIKLTLESLLICSICYLNMIGATYLVPKAIQTLGEAKTYNISYFTELIIYGSIQLPNGFIGGWMAESKLFGRRGTIWVSSVLCAFFYFISYYWPRYLGFYAGEIMLFNSIAFGCAFIYVSEVFPTKIRDHAQGFIQFFSFILGSWSPYMINYVKADNLMTNFLILGFTCLLCGIIAFCLRVETQSRPLDDDF
jgi:MFS family permease